VLAEQQDMKTDEQDIEINGEDESDIGDEIPAVAPEELWRQA